MKYKNQYELLDLCKQVFPEINTWQIHRSSEFNEVGKMISFDHSIKSYYRIFSFELRVNNSKSRFTIHLNDLAVFSCEDKVEIETINAGRDRFCLIAKVMQEFLKEGK
jgi:hypothetical protein